MPSRVADVETLPRPAPGRWRDVRGEAGIVFDPARVRQADWRLFEPQAYPGAVPVDGAGGRGSAWFVEGDAGPAVLKRYRRGGLVAALSEDAYLWTGEASVRSLREFALLELMHGAGLPVPAPIAAGWRRSGLVYRAALLTQRLGHVEPMVDAVRRRGAEAPWAGIGTTLARFHRAGFHHADLNAHNILLMPDDTVHLIDWDKGVAEAGVSSWCEAVLARLERSLRKLGIDDAVLAAGMARLRDAHDRGLTP